MKQVFLFGLLIVGTTLSGCSTTLNSVKGDSTIYFRARNNVSLSAMSIDGVSLGFAEKGLDVLAGTHTASARYEIKKVCEAYTVLHCISEKLQGICDISVITEAGHSYVIDISGIEREPFVHVVEAETRRPAGSGLCHFAASGHEFEHR